MAIPVDDQGTMYHPENGAYTGPNADKYKNQASPSPSPPPKPPIFNTTNSQSDGVNKLKRIEFEFDGKSYKFVLNPEEYVQIEPNRVSVTQTKAGAWIDDFGGGVQTISMKGTTGFKNGTKNPSSGFIKFKKLRDLIRNYYFKQYPGTPVTPDKEMIFHNYTDGEHWVVVPKQFSLMRSIARPMLYVYDIQLICQRPADQPAITSSRLSITLPKNEVK